jgi:LacI family transcriptional regulator
MMKRDGRHASPTIHDVAEQAGVSASTVSLALNTPHRVRPDTLERIYAVVRELNFVPKQEAAARARKGTRRVGVVAPFTTHGSFMERLKGVIEAADEDHCEIVVYNQESVVLHRHLVESLSLTNKLDGIILMATPISERLAQRLLHDGLNTVLVEYGRADFPCVVIDDAEGGRLAGEYLVQRGHRTCAYLGVASPPGIETKVYPTQETARLDGFRRGLAAHSVDLPECYALQGHPFADPRDAVNHLLDLDPRPTAIFTMADDLAVDVLKVARERGYSVPDHLAVIGFDDREFADPLGLTTVRQPLAESGRIAFWLLRDRLGAATPGTTTTVTLPVAVIPRSTA